MSEQYAWKIWDKVAIDGRAVGKASVGRTADLNDVRSEECLERRSACFTQTGDVCQSQKVVEDRLLLVCRDKGLEPW